MDKEKVIAVLMEIEVLLELKGENVFKCRAYGNAARAIENLEEPLEVVVKEKRLGQIKGIGEGLQKKITELVETSRLVYYEELKASVPPGLLEMLNIPSLGPKKVKALYEKLQITSVEQLRQACLHNLVAQLEGFGEKTQAKLLEGIQFRQQYAARHLLVDVLILAEPILENLRAHPDVIRCSTAGSVRRCRETIGDVDFLVSSNQPAAVIGLFCSQPGIMKVVARGDTKATVIVEGGIQADLRVVTDAEYPFALAYFTGSKEHNIVLRQRAIQRGLRLNEYGLFRSHEETRDASLLEPCQTEDDIYNKLGLAYVPPELREDHGEFDAAENNTLPRLIEWTDLKGSLHNHSAWSDGRGSVADIADWALDLGCDYWAINDHSHSSFQAHGLDSSQLKTQIREINNVNQQLAGRGCSFRLLTGIEVDILGDGHLDLPDEVLSTLDVVVASLHQGFSSSEADNTRRLIQAARNPFVHMLGHLTGRLLLEREPYPVNQKAVIDACAETGTWIELNAHPLRLDMDWRQWPYAKSKGVKCVINCDAHRREHAQYLRVGAGIARKGWLTKRDVINTLPLNELIEALRKKRK